MSAHFDACDCVRISIEDPANRESWPKVTSIKELETFRAWLSKTDIYAIHTPVSGPHVYVAYFNPVDGARVREYLATLLPGPEL